MNNKNTKKRTTPYLRILISFAIVILIGTLLLWLPISTKDRQGLSFMEALFMSTSSTCVTGLTVVANLGTEMSFFGKFVIAMLIEIGGLSFLTIAIFVFIVIGSKVGIGNRLLLKEALNQNTTIGIVGLVKKIVLMSISIQLIGGTINTIILYASGFYPFFDSLGIGMFHAISSFNNAGLDIFGYNSNMIEFQSHWLLNINTMLMIILGGIGFIVIADVIKQKRWRKFSFHTKVVLPATAILLVGGTLLLKLAVPDMTWLQSIFQSVTARTAGFCTYDMSQLTPAGETIMIILMFIGASPCSTGGGIKTTTLFVVFITIAYYARGKTPKAYHRKISDHSIYKAFSLVTIAVIYNALIILAISLIEPGMAVNDITFETISAFGTVGLSKGITASLQPLSQILICMTMFFGRLGPLTIISLWNNNWMNDSNEQIQYVEERLIIG